MSFADQEAQRVLWVPPGEGPSRWVFGDRYTIKADRHNTGGSLGLMEALVPPEGGPPPHIHHDVDESFYVIDGEIEVLDRDRTFVAGPGSFLFVPKGAVHGFKNVGTAQSKLLIMFLPGGSEQFFLELGLDAIEHPSPPAPSQYGIDVRDAERIVARYGAEYI